MPIYVFGSNAMSQLGLGEDADDTFTPTKLTFFDDKEIEQISCGSLHALALTSDRKLYSWGCNDEYALGREGNECIPGEVDIQETPVKMACGDSISGVITEKQNLYCWGTFRNFNGVFGFDSNTRIQKTPKRIYKPFTNFKFIDISSGANFINLLSINRTIWTFGSNDFYELGRKTNPRYKDAYLMPESIFSARMRKINYKFTKVGSGKNHGMGINTDNEVFTWGSNIYGQLGMGDSEDTNCKNLIGLKGVIDACGGENHSLFLTNDGSLYGCGKNDDYQLGLPNDQKYFVPTKVPIENVTKVRTFGNFSIVQVGNVLYSFGTCYSGGMGFDDDHVLKPTRIPFDFPEIMDFQVGSNFAVVATK